MSRNVQLTDTLYQYVLDHSVREPAVLRELHEETAKLPMAGMQIGADQGQLMALLVKLLGAKRCLEVGVFTGYSSLAVALALPPDGKIIACDVSEEWTAIARRYWKKAGVDGKIDLRLGPAVATLDDLLAKGEAGRFDFAFIDADKGNYLAYYERCLQLIETGTG
jgi:caffeoyl-CoA O-methyltransferase